MKKPETHILKAKTRQQIAEEYGIHRNTLSNQLKKANIKLPHGILMPKDIKLIYDALGWPDKYGLFRFKNKE